MGFPFKKFVAALTTLAPIVLLLVPGGDKVAPFVPVILAGIAEAEKIKGATGPEKKAHVQSLVAGVADGIALAKPGEIDKEELLEASGSAIDAIIATIRVIETAQANLPALPPLVVAITEPKA
jgi:hypothetical protein